jgi:triacylglycerol lipase
MSLEVLVILALFIAVLLFAVAARRWGFWPRTDELSGADQSPKTAPIDEPTPSSGPELSTPADQAFGSGGSAGGEWPQAVPSPPEPDPDRVESTAPCEALAAQAIEGGAHALTSEIPALVADALTLKTRFPIVLAHGLMGFDSIGFGRLRHEYFRGVPSRLRALGVEVHVLRVPPLAAIRKRAEELARQIERLPAERVNIIAHSMGGLDARYAISQLGIADRVASLTTIGTPHHGAPLAAAGALLLRPPFRRLLATAGLDALYDLTPTSMQRFNAEVLDAPGVEYACCVAFAARGGASEQRLQRSFLPVALGSTSDGLVPCDSQRWGSVLREIDADHWAQIGWSARFDAAAFYVDLVRTLRARGF